MVQLGNTPESLKAWEDGWTQLPSEDEPFEVLEEDDFFNFQFKNSLSDTLIGIANRMDAALSSRGQNVNSVTIFKYLLHPAMDTLVDYTSQQLVKKGKSPTTLQEMWCFVGTLMFRTGFNCSTELAWTQMEKISEVFVLMEISRYKELLGNLRGYDVNDRSPRTSDDTWLCRSNLLCNMNLLERLMFQRSVSTLLNKESGVVVIDDELISSRALDVEQKTLSDRKSGKEGPVSDCLSCSLTCIMYGMHLRVKGESQADNVVGLVDTLSNLNHKAQLTFDRGYGKRKFLDTMISKGFQICTFAATMGSRHPLIARSEVQTYESKLRGKGASPLQIAQKVAPFQPWVVNEGNYLGSETRTATVSSGDGYLLYAIAVREVFDRKADSKLLHFFISGKEEDLKDLDNKWIAICKSEIVPPNTLFNGIHWESKDEVEAKLLLNCNPLTIGQRCADWFLLRTLHLFTGTKGAKYGRMPADTSDTSLAQEMESLCTSWFKRFKSSDAMKQGTLNEIPTAEAFALEPFVQEFFEVGLLEHKRLQYVAVSPDGVATFLHNNEVVVACVEIKTRVSETTQTAALEALEAHGRIVHCVFNIFPYILKNEDIRRSM